MSGITSGIGLISGIDTATLIEQLLQVEARPKFLANQRIINLQVIQTSYLDIASRMRGLETAAAAFRSAGNIFQSKSATSSLADSIRATASNGTPEGTYNFVVDRLVTTQQMLSRGFADRDQSPFGATSLTFESEQGRLDRDALLADLNSGSGVRRGTIKITQGGDTARIDLGRAATISEVVEAINQSEDVDVTASIKDGALVLSTTGADFTVSTASGSTGTAEDLGIVGTSTAGTLAGTALSGLSASTLLSRLNDGNGVFIGTESGTNRYDIVINVGGTDVNINLGAVFEEVTVDDETTIEEVEAAPTNVAGILDRINTQLADAGFGEVTASIVGQGLQLQDSSSRAISVSDKNATSNTAAHLGLLGSDAGGTISGRRLVAGLGTVLLSNINGGSGLQGDGNIQFTSRDGTVFSVDLSAAETIEQVIDLVNSDAGNAGRIQLSLNSAGSGLAVTDTTGQTTNNLIIAGEAANSLGLATEEIGVAANNVRGTNLQRKYVATGTLLKDLNGGNALGTGTFRLTDGFGASTTINFGEDSQTVYDLIREINGQASSAGLNLEIDINETGDGLVIREKDGQPAGTQAIRVEDVEGSVASALRLEGEGGKPGEVGEINQIVASQEVTVTFDPTDTLDDALTKINDAGAGVQATIINDGSGVAPFRISLVSKDSGSAGRFLIDDLGFNLGLDTLEKGEDARVFFGSDDPSKAVLLTSSDNTLDDVITGLSLDLVSASDEVVSITVSRNTESIETTINAFVEAYNSVITRITGLTGFDSETERRGALLGDSTTNSLRQRLASVALGRADGVDGAFSRLGEVGVTLGEGGKLEFDRDRFREALNDDPDAVAEVFAARKLIPRETDIDLGDGASVTNTDTSESFSKLGVVFQIEELVQTYVDSIDGVLTRRDSTVKAQIESQERRVENFDRQLDRRRAQLTQQFLAMEQALLSLQGQQSALSSLIG